MDIVEKSNTTLRLIEQNDPKLKVVSIVNRGYDRSYLYSDTFWLHDGADLTRLGNAIANNTHLEEIAFHESSKWGDHLDGPLLEGMHRNTTIKKLSLHDGIGIGILNEYVANSSNLTKIAIHGGDLREGIAESIVPAFNMCPKLNEIAICICKVDDASLKEFALGIRGISTLQKLSVLHTNAVVTDDYTGTIDGTEGAKAIAALFHDTSCNITDLKLHSVGFSNESVQTIVNGLRGNTKLVKLDLSGSSIEGSGCEAIVSLLQTPSCNITSLNIGGRDVDNESVKIIVRSLAGSNTKLEHLCLSFNNNIVMSGCESIATLLQTPSCNLTKLDLRNCEINNECIQVIFRSLRGNTKLEHLDLSMNNIGRSGCESIATLLQDSNSNINEIRLSCCKVDDDCAVLLARSLRGNNKLTRLDLAGNSLFESGWNAFSTILSNCSNHTLCSLGGKVPARLLSLLKLNRVVDMEPLFVLDKDDDERKPKALPYVIDWFDRRARRSQNMEIVKCIDSRKLSSIFQFARAMPLKFVPASHFTHPSVASLIQLKEGRYDDLESKYRELQKRNSKLEKQVVAKDAEIASMKDAKKKSDDDLKAKEDEIKDLYGRLDSIVNVAKKRKNG